MAESTNLNVSPYYADYDESKSYQKVLFKPGVALQSRELVELQSILQNQIEKMGNNIYRDGTVIEGCNFTFDNKYDYVKILDVQTNQQPVVLDNYVGFIAKGLRSGISARIVNFAEGFETQTPNLSTLYVEYLDTGYLGEKTFLDNENINILRSDGTAYTRLTTAGSVDPNPIGKGFAVHVTDGICYHRGYFVGVSEQTLIVSRYDPLISGKSIGFTLDENIITTNNDQDLFDPASGSQNFNAPGADRLKIEAVLEVYDTATTGSDFFSLADINQGAPVTRQTNTQFASIDDSMSLRLHEQSGSYTVNKNDIGVESANTSALFVQVGAGTSYVRGRRTQQYNTTRLVMPKASDSITSESENISMTMGNYVVGTLAGNFPSTLYPKVDLKEDSSVIGTARVRTIMHHSGETTASIRHRAYLFDIRMTSGRDFTSVDNIDGTSWTMTDVTDIRENTIKSAIFSLGGVATNNLANTSLIHRVSDTSIDFDTDGNATITLSGNDQWLYSNTWSQSQRESIVIVPSANVDDYVAGTPLHPNEYSIVSTGQTATITLNTAPSSSLASSIIYDVQREAIRQMDKVSTTKTITIDTSTHANGNAGPWCLGHADVQSIVATIDGVDVSLKLDNGARDTHYGLAYVSDPKGIVEVDDVITIVCKSFVKDTTAGGRAFFSVDSYIDVGLAEIPIYTSSTGARRDLRDAIDCRPVVSPTATGSTATNPASTEAYGTGLVFSPDHLIETDVTRNIGRMDKLTIDTSGRLGLVRGVSSTTPYPPADSTDALTIATITVPPLPSLSPRDSFATKRPEYVVSVSPTITRGYTMSDIGAMDRRLRNLEYYTALTALEGQTNDISVVDSNGLTRFKNGILVDPFDNLSIADISNPAYSAGVDHGASELIPRFDTNEITLKVESTNGVTLSDDVATLPYTRVNCISQSGATRVRNCVQSYWNYVGRVKIHPEYDAGVDNTTTPVRNISVDLAQGFNEFSDALNEIFPLTVEDTERLSVEQNETNNVTTLTNSSGEVSRVTSTTTNTTETFLTTARSLLTGSRETHKNVGDFVTDVSFSPFMRSRRVNVFITGLRPNTRHYAWFDEIPVNQSMSPARYLSNKSSVTPIAIDANLPNESIVKNITRSGNWGDPLISNSNGTLFAVFNIPAGKFIVGDRELLLADVATRASLDTATSTGSVRYSAFNYSVNKAGLTTSTRLPTFTTTSSSLTSTQTSSSTTTTTEVVTPAPTGEVVEPLPVTPDKTPIVISEPEPDFVFIPPEPTPTHVSGKPPIVVIDEPNPNLSEIEPVVVPPQPEPEPEESTEPDPVATVDPEPVTEPPTPDPVVDPVPLETGSLEEEEEVVPIVGGSFTPPTSNVTTVPDYVYDQADLREFPGGSSIVPPRTTDPIAQTVRILPQYANGGEGIFVESIDLYFAAKSDTVGVSVQIRETQNGYPTNEVLPFADIWLASNQVNTSTSSLVGTRVLFPTPVFLRANAEYAIVVKPDANSPDFQIFTRKVGGIDVATGLPVSQDWGVGTLFSSTNDSAWISYQDEDLKFKINRCEFTSQNGRLILVNSDQEYLTLEAESAFIMGEDIYQVEAPSSGTITMRGNVATGHGTSLASEYSVGDTIVLTGAGKDHVATVTAIASGSSMTLDTFMPSATYSHMNTCAGLAQSQKNSTVVLSESTAKTGNVFAATRVIRGAVSGVEATIQSVADIDASRLQYQAQRIALQGTTIEAGTRVANRTTGSTDYEVSFGRTVNLTANDGIVASRSNEVTRGTGKSLKITNILETQSSYITPVIDHVASQAKLFSNIITEDALDEHLPDASDDTTRYISKTVELAENMDAEDLKVYLTSYRPPNTNVEVYARLMSNFDERDFNDVAWTKLVTDNGETFSSPTNRNDFKEVEYSIPTMRPQLSTHTGSFDVDTNVVTLDEAATIEEGAHVSVTYENGDVYSAYVSAATSTSLTLVGTFDDLGSPIDVIVGVIDPEYVSTSVVYDDKISYWSGQGYYTSFGLFAIKIVMTSNSHNRVPRIRDMRAIAVSG